MGILESGEQVYRGLHPKRAKRRSLCARVGVVGRANCFSHKADDSRLPNLHSLTEHYRPLPGKQHRTLCRVTKVGAQPLKVSSLRFSQSAGRLSWVLVYVLAEHRSLEFSNDRSKLGNLLFCDFVVAPTFRSRRRRTRRGGARGDLSCRHC